jgi:hypothetical protein
MRRIPIYGGLIVMWLLWGVEAALAQQGNTMRAPITPRRTERPVVLVPESTLPVLVLDAYLRFFQQVISPVDGARSKMYPTGSASSTGYQKTRSPDRYSPDH